ncbi:hypothetical protein LSAT2_024971 [Lamellibrachia satsuma]|nr:hypothetical protein LSAT2_024971 [Lamellibrachia satsuma]
MDTHDCSSCHGNIETSSQDAMRASRSDQRRESVIAGLAKPRLRRSLTLTRREHLEPVDSSTPCAPEDVVSAYCGGDRRSSNSSEFDTDLEEEAAEDVLVNTGRRTYALVCRKLRVNPISAIQRTLSEQEIRVRRRGLSACDVLALACALQGNSNVRALDLEDNQLGSKGAKYLASLLWDNTYIRSLGLGYNDLGHDGAIALGEMLLENGSLTHINVSGLSSSFTSVA